MRSTLLFLILASISLAQDYFPLQVGNQWIYRVGGNLKLDPVVTEITGTETLDGVTYFALKGFASETLLLRRNDAGTLVIFDRTEKREKTWAAFAAATGEAWRTEVDPCNSTGVIRTREDAIKLPVGEFPNGLTIGYQIARCADAGLTAETFLPDVGLVQRRTTTIAGERTFDLVYARINDSTIVTGPEFTFGVTLDHYGYGPGQTILARLNLRNAKGFPRFFNFPTGQDFDIVIRNEKGEEVYRWSAGKAFTQAFREVRLDGEKNWAVSIDLDRRWFNLQPGDYTLTATLAAVGPKLESTVGFVLFALR